MSNHLAIATVTVGLGERLRTALTDDLGQAITVSYGPPRASEENGEVTNVLNVFLYQTTTNGALSNIDLPTRGVSGSGIVNPPLVALNLHYLLTFYGEHATLIPQRMLGSAVRTLESKPVLTRELIQTVRADELHEDYLSDSDLEMAAETVKFVPEQLSLEELSKVWSILFQTPYALSAAYRASAVLIESKDAASIPLPVQHVQIVVSPSAEGEASLTPGLVDGLQLWLKSDKGVTYTNEGVSAWRDQSENAHDALQADGDARPAFVAHGLGKRPVLRFDGADDYLAISGLSYSAADPIEELTVCALVRTESSDAQIMVSFDAERYWQLDLVSEEVGGGGEQNLDVAWITTDTDAVTHALGTLPKVFTDGRWHLIIATFERSDGDDKRIDADGESHGEASAHGNLGLGAGDDRFGFIGVGSNAGAEAGATGGERFLAADVAEVLVFHHALSSQERAGLEKYFVERYRG